MAGLEEAMMSRKVLSLIIAFLVSLSGLAVSLLLAPSPVIALPPAEATSAVLPLLEAAPTQPLGKYQYFGEQIEPAAARQLVIDAGLNPDNPDAYLQVGAIEITEELLADGREIFFDRGIGDMFGVQRVLGFRKGVFRLLPEFFLAVLRQGFRPTSDLTIYPLRPIHLGDQTLRPGIPVSTGLDLTRHGFKFRTLGDLIQSFFPIGLRVSGNITCAVCHATVDRRGNVLDGIPNGDLNVPLFIALAPNSAAGFARLNLTPSTHNFRAGAKPSSTLQVIWSNYPIQLCSKRPLIAHYRTFPRVILRVLLTASITRLKFPQFLPLRPILSGSMEPLQSAHFWEPGRLLTLSIPRK